MLPSRSARITRSCRKSLPSYNRLSGLTNTWPMSEPVRDKRKYFLMKSKYGPCRCGKTVTGRYLQFPLGCKKHILQSGCLFSRHVYFHSPLPSLLHSLGTWKHKCPLLWPLQAREQTQLNVRPRLHNA